MTRISDIASFAVIVGMAVLVDRFANLDAVTFIAASALWYGIRAWSEARHVSTAHKYSEDK